MSSIDKICIPVEEDVRLLRELEVKSVIYSYLGTVKVGEAYKDIYISIMPDRSTHIIEVRRLCIEEKVNEQR
ncbi:MAG: hypothetical protein QXU08_06160 [Ignisphaera sp.]